MRALHLQEFEGPDALHLEEVADPDGELLIDVHAAGVSFADLLMTNGQYQVRPDLPFVPGMEAAGVVHSAPQGSPFQKGDRVAAFVFVGGFAERVAAEPRFVVRIPESMDFPEAAGFTLNYLTAWFALRRRAHLEAGERVLVHGAAGGVGTATIQVAKALEATVIGVVSGERKAEIARRAGADEVIVLSENGWRETAMEATDGEGVDVVIDPVGGDRFNESLRVLAPEGRLVVVGFASGSIPEVKVNRLLLRNISVLGAAVREFEEQRPGYAEEARSALERLAAEERVAPIVGQQYPLEEGAQALRDLAERRAVGKAVIVVR